MRLILAILLAVVMVGAAVSMFEEVDGFDGSSLFGALVLFLLGFSPLYFAVKHFSLARKQKKWYDEVSSDMNFR